MSRNRYSPEFKRDAVAAALEYGTAETARRLGLNENMLYRWKKSAEHTKEHAAAGLDSLPLEQRVKQLEEENRILRMEKEILKKATAFFAKETS
jgi:transposase